MIFCVSGQGGDESVYLVSTRQFFGFMQIPVPMSVVQRENGLQEKLHFSFIEQDSRAWFKSDKAFDKVKVSNVPIWINP